MQPPRHDQNPKTKQRGNEQYAESGPVSAVEIKNQRYNQGTDRRACLIERFV